MEKKLLAIYLIVFTFTILTANETIIIQPDSTSGKDASVHSFYPSSNYGKSGLLQALDWTISGNDVKLRFFIDFNLTSLPANAVIESAKLSLYESHENAASVGHSHLSGSNACYIRRVTSAWDEKTITWNNQPSYSTDNQILLPQDTSSSQNYTDIDVTELVRDIRDSSATSYGLMCMLANESAYRSMLFASSNHPNIAKHPKLILTYSIPVVNVNEIVIQPDSTNGKDASVHSFYPSTNYGKSGLLQALDWTISGNDVKLRFFIDFNLSSLPDNAVIESAKLSLYESHENAASVGHSHLSGSNACYLRRVTSAWDEKTITWNNQPSYSTNNQILLPQDTSSSQNYTDIDVTELVRDIRNNSATSYGLMCMLANESAYRSMLFASSNNDSYSKHPKLVIRTSTLSLIEKIGTESLRIFPNPTSEKVKISFENSKNKNFSISIFNTQGKLIFERHNILENTLEINTIGLQDGLYLVALFTDGYKIATNKIMIKK